jgi:CubicO group peptidase (beta-lactamase class C family)
MRGEIADMHRQLWCLTVLIWIGHSSAIADPMPTASSSTTPAVEQVEAGTPGRTPAGTTFTVPAGWSMSASGQVVVLSPPEPDLKFALIDVEAKDAVAAVAAGWAAFNPSFKRPLRVTEPQAPRNGWEERAYFDYEVSPNEKLVVTVYAWRAGTNWLVGILQSSEATIEKRGGPYRLLRDSLRPKGYQPETFANQPAHPIDAHFIAAMKQFVTGGIRQLQVPGVALSLIDGGRIVYEGGIGVRELGRPDPIDADTLFMAASNTKALSTLLLAELVDEKKLRWDEPVTEAYPAFKLGDAATTRKVLIKHLVCACTGMPRQDDFIFRKTHETPAIAMQKLGTMQPSSNFGEVFQYNNRMAAAAGFIGGTIAVPNKELGAAYDEAMQQKVLGPLRMTRSTFDFAKAMQGDYARPHDVDIDGNPVVGRMTLNYAVVSMRPAGGLWTSAHDLSQYVMMELAKGELPDGQRLVSEENLLQRRVPNVVVAENIDYGMGLIIDKHWGVTMVHHGGDLFGYHSDMMWFPEYNVGAVILTNGDTGDELPGPFLRKLVELMFDGKPEADAQLKAAVAQIDGERAKDRERLQVPADPVVVAKLAARYSNQALGPVIVTRKGKDVFVRTARLNSQVASRKNDDGSISFVTISPTMQGFEFVVSEREHKRVLIMRDAQHEYVFVEQ